MAKYFGIAEICPIFAAIFRAHVGYCHAPTLIKGIMKIFLRHQRWTDADMVAAVLGRDNARLERMYSDCHAYFRRHAGAFFVADADIDDIFQDALLHLWREIETRRIEVIDGRLCRWTEGEARPMTSSLTTFLMSVAQRKHWELQRSNSRNVSMDAMASTDAIDALATERYGATTPEEQEAQTARESIVSDCILAMSDRCREILTLFYYQQRTLDDILSQRQENTSKMGLKTSKYKCMQRLRQQVQQLFKRYDL